MERKITKRFVLHVGFSCNERCVFCYYRDSLEKGTVKDLSTKEIKKRLHIARRYNKTAVDFSGGEPTIRKDIFEIISYAKKIGFKDICIITNGLQMNSHEFCKKLVESGLNDVLFSIHSPSSEIHDSLTQVKGSWSKIMQAMSNMKKLNTNYRVNTVVNDLNYKDLGSYFSLLKKYNPKEINLLVFNPAEETINYKDNNVNIEDYNIIAKNIKEALDKHASQFNKINIRFLPFCLLKGHEKRIRTMWQKIYEEKEWDPYLFMRFRKNNLWALYSFIVGFFTSLPNGIPFYGKKNFHAFLCETIQAGRIFYNKKHTKSCKKCSLRKICPGLPRAYIKKYNKTKLYPYHGKIIKGPLYFGL